MGATQVGILPAMSLTQQQRPRPLKPYTGRKAILSVGAVRAKGTHSYHEANQAGSKPAFYDQAETTATLDTNDEAPKQGSTIHSKETNFIKHEAIQKQQLADRDGSLHNANTSNSLHTTATFA
ncbi:hypothetical protein Nepgr_005247 [Nepenthes gracilis]|uniref:Uncharacterized protein n=1 Tax=Nepenthes gracilis TaxID=150966 RepID=A0AAD3S2U3_NEPGR|nr:hypothetical protein Nepgr_005247 [Nepenthes gracilis]